MLAPEVWNFQPPSCAQQVEKGSMTDDKDCVDFCVSTHHFNHSVSVVIPTKEKIPESVLHGPTTNSDYYKVEKLPVLEFISLDFISNFVKKGSTSATSIGTMIDCDNCVCLTPSGTLVLSLEKVDYERLGLEGKPSFFCRMKPPSRYVVTIDLTQEYFKPNKKNYERVVKSLLQNLSLKMDFIITWDPPSSKICPSSIGAYFENCGYKVSSGNMTFKQNKQMDIHIPNNVIGCESEEIFEWIGAVSIGANMSNWFESTTEFTIGDDTTSSPIHTLQCTGFYSSVQIGSYLEVLRDYLKTNKDIPWLSFHVQGFEDSAVNWKLKENCFHQSGENSYTIILDQENKFHLCKTLGANRKSKAHSK